MEGMCPSKHSPVGIQETLTESNQCISTSGFEWESLGPNASIEFHPGQEGQDVAKVPGPGRRPTPHSILHRSSFLQGGCWSTASPQFSEGWKGKGRNSPAGRPSTREQRGRETAQEGGRRGGREGKGSWEARQQPGDGRSNQSKPQS